MKRSKTITARDLLIPGAIAAGAATGFAVVLSMIATPGDLSERASNVSTRADALQHDFGSARSPQPADLRRVCFTPVERAKYDLQSAIANAAGPQGVTISDFRASADPTIVSGAIQPVVFHFAATGPYDGVVGILRRLAANKSEVFVDSADLVSNTTNVTLSFTGRLFCAV